MKPTKLPILLLAIASTPLYAQYPTAPQITDKNAPGQIRVQVKDLFVAPKSTTSSTASVARVNFLRAEPVPALAASRLFTNDNNGNLYTVNRSTGAFTPYINFATEFTGEFDNSPGFAAGSVTFQFDPAYATNGKFYTVHTELGAASPSNFREAVLYEWHDTNINDNTFTGSKAELLRVVYNGNIHPIGDIAFNPTANPGDPDYRNMYISSGDGGAGEQSTATLRSSNQRLDNFLGKVLRITPSASGTGAGYTTPASNPFQSLTAQGARPEIYAYGFRNPHRLSFDGPTAYISDIGLHSYEEINILKPGANYGYSTLEGNQVLASNNSVNNNPLPSTLPIYTTNTTTSHGNIAPTYPAAMYSHEDGDAISSGFVYRGTLIPELVGKFVFGDITTARLFYTDVAELTAADADGNPLTTAAIHELKIFYDSPYVAGTILTEQRLFDIIKDRFDRRNETAQGSTANNTNNAADGDTLPGSADVTSGNDPYGIAYGGGRADIRLALIDNEIVILSKADGLYRSLIAIPEPTSALLALPSLLLIRRRR